MNGKIFIGEISNTITNLQSDKMAEVFRFKSFESNVIFGPHKHTRIEIDFVRKGDCIMIFGDELVTLKENEMIFIFSNAEHKFISGNKGCMLMQLEFLPDIFGAYEPLLNDHSSFITANQDSICKNYIKIVNSPDIVIAVESILKELSHELPYAKYMVSLTYGKLLILISRYLNEYIEDCCCPLFGRIMSYINENYTNEITVKSIAKSFSISERYLRKLFSKYIHISPNSYITQIRIDKAKQMLEYNTEMLSIKEICYICGFSSPQQFSRLFKHQFNSTPSDYLRRNIINSNEN